MQRIIQLFQSPEFAAALIAAKAFAITIGYWLLATGLVNLVARKSQVEAWCEKRPRLAAVLKVLRGIGFDPWLIIQAAALWTTGKLPAKLRALIPIVCVLPLLTGCGILKSPTTWDIAEEACKRALTKRPEVVAEATARKLTGIEWATFLCKLPDIIEPFATETAEDAADHAILLARPRGLVR
jgi:hypothetical protein